MRLVTLCIPLLLGIVTGAHADEGDFAGAWNGWVCPAGVKSHPAKCANFGLELHQKADKLCGSHVFATPGAKELDEGGTPSLIGDVVNEVGFAAVVSGRSEMPTQLQVELKVIKNTLHWRRLDTPPGDYLLPKSAKLTRSKSKSMFAPLFAQQLQTACANVLPMADAGNIPGPLSSTPALQGR